MLIDVAPMQTVSQHLDKSLEYPIFIESEQDYECAEQREGLAFDRPTIRQSWSR